MAKTGDLFEILGPSGDVHYRRPGGHPMIDQAKNTPGYSVRRTSAVISDCGTYRYWLERGDEGAPYVAWVLANPSTADAYQDDPTVRKARGFTERWGYQRFVFVNLFAGRSTDPKGLLKLSDPIGAENENYMAKAIDGAEFVVLAWGNAVVKKLRSTANFTVGFVRSRIGAEKIMCLGYTADRAPRHPLMLAYSTPLEVYRP